MKVKEYIRGATWKPRLTITDKATGLALVLSTYTVSWALKSSPDEATTYIVAKTTGLGDSSGHLDATILDTATDDVIPGNYTAEWQWQIGTGATLVRAKYQYPVIVKARVITT